MFYEAQNPWHRPLQISHLMTERDYWLTSQEIPQSISWSTLWDEGDFLPWDRATPNPALDDVLAYRQDLIGDCFVGDGKDGQRRKKALLPGCGRGYDVMLLANFGYDSYGLEISGSAGESRKQMDTTTVSETQLRVRAKLPF